MYYWKIDIDRDKISLDIYLERKDLAKLAMTMLANIYDICDKNTKREILP